MDEEKTFTIQEIKEKYDQWRTSGTHLKFPYWLEIETSTDERSYDEEP